MAIGKSLKRFRKELKLTQTSVAEKLGILQQTYYKYENDKATPSADFVIKLADAYNVSADYLLGRSDNPHPQELDVPTLELMKSLQVWKATPVQPQGATV